jgi:hypothetical protein
MNKKSERVISICKEIVEKKRKMQEERKKRSGKDFGMKAMI